MTLYLCVPRDGHERCITCLGLAHAEAAFVDESCTHCGRMTISELRSRLQLLQRGGVPVPLPRSNPHQRVAASGDTGDLRITVSAFPSGNQPPRNPHSSCTPQPAELPEERGGPSQRCAPPVSFGAPLDDRMSIAASEGESDFAGDDASAQVTSFGYGGCARYRSGDDGYAFPGRQQGRARVESSTVSWTLKAGRLVSRGGTSWFSATHPGSFLPGGAWRAHWYVEGTFYCPKPRQWALLPHHPWWRGG